VVAVFRGSIPRIVSCVLKGKTGGNSERSGSGVALTGASATFFSSIFSCVPEQSGSHRCLNFTSSFVARCSASNVPRRNVPFFNLCHIGVFGHYLAMAINFWCRSKFRCGVSANVSRALTGLPGRRIVCCLLNIYGISGSGKLCLATRLCFCMSIRKSFITSSFFL